MARRKNPGFQINMQTALYVYEEADKFYERHCLRRSFIVDYLMTLFPKKALSRFDIAEFGIGSGSNLMLLMNYARSIHGYDGSKTAIEHFKASFRGNIHQKKCFAKQVNLCEKFTTPIKYNLAIMGFFAYYASYEELLIFKENLLNSLVLGGYVFIEDFLVRKNTMKTDSRNNKIKIFKRNIAFWLNFFKEFNLIDFRLFMNGEERSNSYLVNDAPWLIDMEISEDDDLWTFGALFKLRSKK